MRTIGLTATLVPISRMPTDMSALITPTVSQASLDPTPTPTLPYEKLVHLFDYDRTASLHVQERSESDRDGVKIHDISYATQGGRVTAYLVAPPGQGPFPGVVFLHWGGGNRSEFLDEALQFAKRGVVSLLIDAPWNWRGFVPRSPDDTPVQTVISIRRAVDLLVSRPDVDANRLGYVGHSLGATWGGVLAGVEKRITAYVLMAGYARPSVYYPSNAPSPFLDAIHHVGHAAPSPLFFQFAKQDEYVAKSAALEFYEAGSDPKLIRWYDAMHSLSDRARLDRVEWLGTQLGLGATR